jgi:hypothetical protein
VSQTEKFLTSLESCRTVTLSSQKAITKTSTLSFFVDELLIRQKQVHYVDLDLQYSSMISNEDGNRDHRSPLLQIFRSDNRHIIDLFVKVLDSAEVSKGGTIIVDSINMLQILLLRQNELPTNFVKSNHQAAVLITLLEEFAFRYSKTLILANLARPRPRNTPGTDSQTWDFELSGGRMIRLKSDLNLSAKESSEGELLRSPKIELKVETVTQKHPRIFEQGESFDFPLKSFL